MNKLFLMLLAMAALVACNKKETTEPSSDVRLVSKIIMTESEGGDISRFDLQFSYNSKNQLNDLKIKMPIHSGVESSEKYSWEYGTDAVTFTVNQSFRTNIFTSKGTYKLDADGAAVSKSGTDIFMEDGVEIEKYTTNEEYTYSNGFLSEFHRQEEGNEDPEESTSTFIWDGNNIITKEVTSSISISDWETKYEYDGIYNKKCNIDLIQMLRNYNSFSEIPINLGKRSQGLLVKKTNYSETNPEVHEYSYEYDSKGYITKIIEKRNLKLITFDITYKDNATRQ